MASEQEFIEQINTNFDISDLTDPNACLTVGSLIIGGAIATKRGLERSSEHIMDIFPGDDFDTMAARGAARELLKTRAAKNMSEIAGLVGDAVLQVDVLDPSAPTKSVTGDLSAYSPANCLKLYGPDQERPDALRLTGAWPGQHYLVDVVGPDLEPLVDINVVDRPVFRAVRAAGELLSLR